MQQCDTCRYWLRAHPLATRDREGLCGKLSDEIYCDTEPERIRFHSVNGHAVLTLETFGCTEHDESLKR